MTLKSFLLTYDKEHKYTFYIGIDRNDKIFDNKQNKQIFGFSMIIIYYPFHIPNSFTRYVTHLRDMSLISDIGYM